jgi:serine/threonine protein kinase
VNVGSVIADRFRVDEAFSSGGLSKSYKGFDLKENRDVLIRVMQSSKRGDKNALKRFEVAAAAAQKVEHPGIVPLLHAGVLNDGLPYLVYNFMRAHNLRDEIARDGKLVANRVRDIMLQVTVALEKAHDARVVHRNMKPGNILIGDDESGLLVVYVTGFGIARSMASSGNTSSIILNITQTKKVVGSPTYMAPEQFASTELDARADIYTLGCVMYEMLTGHPPFQADSYLTTAARHSFDAADSISAECPDVPPYLEAIVAVCLRKKPENRYQTMQELHQDLMARQCRFPDAKFGDDLPPKATRAAELQDPVARKVAYGIGIAAIVAALAWLAMHP